MIMIDSDKKTTIIYAYYEYPLVMTNIAMENQQF